jgi:hypothetical protein
MFANVRDVPELTTRAIACVSLNVSRGALIALHLFAVKPQLLGELGVEAVATYPIPHAGEEFSHSCLAGRCGR